jgi:integrase
MSVATASIIHDTRIKTKDETYAVKLRVTYERVQKYFPIGSHLTKADWAKTQDTKARKDYKDNRLYFNKIEAKAVKIIKDLEIFSFQAFEKKFNQQSAPKKDLFYLMKEYEDKLTAEERLNTASSYKSSLKSFKNFAATTKKTKVLVAEVTSDWLLKYEKWMRDAEASPTTIGIYLRNLRTILNIAIEEGTYDRSLYPFGKRKFQIPAGKNVKKALAIADIKRIFDYNTISVAQEKARDLWIFSYLCNGANVKDVVKLQYKNITSKHITFIRSKTERSTKSNQKPVVIVNLPEIQALINKWGVEVLTPETYVFGIINESDTPQIQLAKIKQITKIINKYMKKIGEKLELDLKLTTYSARHSFATVLKRSGAPIEFISESLGHKDLRTTENYLDSFVDEAKESFQKQLLNF